MLRFVGGVCVVGVVFLVCFGVWGDWSSLVQPPEKQAVDPVDPVGLVEEAQVEVSKESRRISSGVRGAMTHRPAAGYLPPETSGDYAALTRFVDRRLPVRERVVHDMFQQIPRVTHPMDIDAVVMVLLDGEDDQNVRNEAINILAQSDFSDLAAVLIEISQDTDESDRFRSFAIQHLGDMYVDGDGAVVESTLRAALVGDSLPLRRESLNKLLEARDAQVFTQLPVFFADAEFKDVQDLVVYGLGLAGDTSVVSEIRALAALEAEDVEIRIAAIRALGTLNDRESFDILRGLRQVKNPRIQAASLWALEKLGK